MGKQENKNVFIITLGILVILFLLYVTIPPLREAMGIYIFGLIISSFTFFIPITKNVIIGINFKGVNLLKSTLYGVIFGIGFLVATSLIPGFSIGIPLLPQAISDTMRGFVVKWVAPIVETIIFQGAFFGIGMLMFNKSVWKANIFQALIFAIAHVSAYVTGFYAYPSFIEGFGAFSANITAFFSAFLFALIAGYFVSRKGVQNLIFVMVFHIILNHIIYAQTYSIIALSSLALMSVALIKINNIHNKHNIHNVYKLKIPYKSI